MIFLCVLLYCMFYITLEVHVVLQKSLIIPMVGWVRGRFALFLLQVLSPSIYSFTICHFAVISHKKYKTGNSILSYRLRHLNHTISMVKLSIDSNKVKCNQLFLTD